MSNDSKAIFLSYARDDADAARRIAEALRGFGVEVWFDQNELRGGEAWDAKLRMQIRSCALFMPVISATTQARSEGYFRREWKLAVDRTQDMAAGRAFLVPVVIDDTAEANALVPEEFMRVQWTRLPGALPTPQFVEQVKRLLSGGGMNGMGVPPMSGNHGRDARATQAGGSGGQRNALRRSSKRPLVVAIGALALAGTGVATWQWLRSADQQNAVTPSKPASTATSRPASVAVSSPEISAKSIAVLPFTNLSAEAENAYFTDGVHEDILTNLASIGELRVISRTSVMQYRGTTKPMRQIGEELRVAYLLEGSVRRAGSKLRLTAQLINARTDEHAWAKTYDRELTDVFAIQSELAKDIAVALQAKLDPQAEAALARAPTSSVRAYELLVEARALLRRNLSPGLHERVRVLLAQVVSEDPNLLEARIALVDLLSRGGGNPVGGTIVNRAGPRLTLPAARQELARARQIAPEDPWVSYAEALYYYQGESDYPNALRHVAVARRSRPREPEFLRLEGRILRRMGRIEEALPKWEEALRLDPRSVPLWRESGENFHLRRQFSDAADAWARLAVLEPERPWTLTRIGFQFLASADLVHVAAFEQEWQRVSADLEWARHSDGQPMRFLPAQWRGDRDELRRQAASFPAPNLAEITEVSAHPIGSNAGLAAMSACWLMLALDGAGQGDAARPLAEAHVRVYGPAVQGPLGDGSMGQFLAAGATWYLILGDDASAGALLARLKERDRIETDAYYRAYRMPLLLPIMARLEPDAAATMFLAELEAPMSFVGLDEIAANCWVYRPLVAHPRVKPLLVKQGKWLPYLAGRVPEYAEFKGRK